MIRYRKLGFVELIVTDLARSMQYYEGVVGLQPAGRGADGSLLFRCSDDDHAIILHEGRSAGFRSVGWMLEDESQFQVLQDRLDAHGVAWQWVPTDECRARGLGRVCRMSEPVTGARLEFYVAPKGGAATFEPSHTRIQRIGHVVFTTPRLSDAVAFYRDVLNFRESDRVEESTTFMRCFPNPFHHGLGLARGREGGFHHLNFMVSNMDDIGRANTRLNQHGVPIVYGPGRHPISNSIFIYFLDPDGLTLEYSFGMEEFPEEGARDARTLPRRPEWSNAWGSLPTERFGMAGSIVRDDY